MQALINNQVERTLFILRLEILPIYWSENKIVLKINLLIKAITKIPTGNLSTTLYTENMDDG